MADIKDVKYGKAIRRTLGGDEKAIVTFEIWGPVAEKERTMFNDEFDHLVWPDKVSGVRGVRLGSEIRKKTEAERQGGRTESRM